MGLMMHISVEQLAQVLATAGISSSQEGNLLTFVKNLTTTPKENEESTFVESYTFDEEQLYEQESKEEKEDLQHDLKDGNQAYESVAIATASLISFTFLGPLFRILSFNLFLD